MYAMLQLFLVFAVTAAAALIVTVLVLYVNLAGATRSRLAVCAAVHGLVMVLLLVVWFNARPGFFDENMRAFAVLSDLRSGTRLPDPQADQGVGLLLIDNARNKTTVAPIDGTEMGQEQVAITDRALLAELFRFLAIHHTKVELVVCDITFEDSSDHDKELADAITALDRHHKILLARGNNENTPALQFSERMMGRVTESLQGEMVAAHQLALDGRRSLPCLMYERTVGAELRPTASSMFLFEEGGPHPGLRYAAFPVALDRFNDRCTALGPALGGEGDMVVPRYIPFPLGYAISEPGREEFLLALEERSQGVARPIVFIGEFGTLDHDRRGTDVHNTLNGPAQGSTVLIDLYLEMLAEAHHVFRLGLLWAWLLLAGLSYVVFIKLLRGSATSAAAEKPTGSSPGHVWRAFRHLIRERVKEQIPLFVFLVLFVALVVWGNMHVNIAAFFLYFLLLNTLFSKIDLSTTQANTTWS